MYKKHKQRHQNILKPLLILSSKIKTSTGRKKEMNEQKKNDRFDIYNITAYLLHDFFQAA